MKTLPILTALIGLAANTEAATILAPGTSITGATTSLNLSLSSGSSRPTAGTNVTLTNSGADLVYTPNSAITSDYFVTWSSLTTIDSNLLRYVQVTFSATPVGAVDSGWQTFFADGDSTIGGGSNSGQGIGTVALGSIPLVVVIDMTAVNGSTGALGWGAAGALSDTVTSLRLDMFENVGNNGRSFTISSVVLGNAVVPEPSSALLGGIGFLALLRRRRA